MPYLTPEDKDRIDLGSPPTTAGQLNYAITKILIAYFKYNGERYQHINDVMGACKCASSEFYRRVAVPYESQKIADNGDVYSDESERSR